MEKLTFEPLDTLFFRDGRPFNQGEGTAGIESQFPPSPLTLVGAARVAWARALGWPGRGKWEADIKANLGGDGEKLDELRFIGPLLEHQGEPVFPAPASLIGRAEGEQSVADIVLLRPGPEIHCDLGEAVRLPVPDVDARDTTEGHKLLEGWWLTRAGLKKVLGGVAPEPQDCLHQSRLWTLESRVGNRIDPQTGTVEESMLYSTRHVRLREGVRLVMGIESEKEAFGKFPKQARVPLGGEARSSWLNKEGRLELPGASVESRNGKIRYAVHVMTPLAPDTPPKPDASFCGLPGKLIAACLPRPQRWGGWDSNKFEPLPMRPYLAPGSVLFMEADADEHEAIEQKHGKTIGQRNTWGFGLILIGQWKQEKQS
jgi:CRISPR-associated protein Cmr3